MTLRSFFDKTRPVLVRVGAHLMRRWRTPPAVDLDDVVQELMVGCCWAFKHYDASREVPVERFVMYNACSRAKKWLHKQRGALRRDDRAPPRYALLFQDVADRRRHGFQREAAGHGEVEWVAEGLRQEPEQHARLEQKEYWRALYTQAHSARLRWGVLALEATGGEPSGAAARLYADASLRMRLRLGSERDAWAIVREVARYQVAVRRAALDLARKEFAGSAGEVLLATSERGEARRIST